MERSSNKGKTTTKSKWKTATSITKIGCLIQGKSFVFCFPGSTLQGFQKQQVTYSKAQEFFLIGMVPFDLGSSPQEDHLSYSGYKLSSAH